MHVTLNAAVNLVPQLTFVVWLRFPVILLLLRPPRVNKSPFLLSQFSLFASRGGEDFNIQALLGVAQLNCQLWATYGIMRVGRSCWRAHLDEALPKIDRSDA